MDCMRCQVERLAILFYLDNWSLEVQVNVVCVKVCVIVEKWKSGKSMILRVLLHLHVHTITIFTCAGKHTLMVLDPFPC